jgi:serine kinase of HPr protein (carbohydrate metabolism regulator)
MAGDTLFTAPSIHASAVLVGATALLIRGPSGSGKSRLVLDILQAAKSGSQTGPGTVPFARLVADDRCQLAVRYGRLLVRPAPALAGLIEWRGLGLLRMDYEPLAQVGAVIDLDATAERLPDAAAHEVLIEGVRLPRYTVAPGTAALALVRSISLGTANLLGESNLPGGAADRGSKEV